MVGTQAIAGLPEGPPPARTVVHAQQGVAADVALACVREALGLAGRDGGTGVAASVVDATGELVAFLRADDAPLRAIRLAIMKAYTAARFGRATAALAGMLEESGRSLAEYGDSRFTGLAGGVPLVVAGGTVGGLGISGRRPSEDHALACATVRRIDALLGSLVTEPAGSMGVFARPEEGEDRR
ncbi:MAG: heme-binding protein [Actinomycetota bacterium]|jgi:uncharacterized protein GlcG (DUF336 family)|nr:heme-binding protein [Actinomycetota bacterium]MDA8341893.1 heme-binding protein [Actinomycetota bacterium]